MRVGIPMVPGQRLLSFTLITCVLLAAKAAAGPRGLTFEAETPFRTDEVDDREGVFDEDFFLNVFSYRPTYRWEEAWRQGQTRYRGIAGSVKKDEFWTDNRIHFLYNLTDWLHFNAYAKEVEDFDSRYRRFNVGVDADPLPFLRLGVFGEVLPEKGEEDFGMRVSLRRLLGHYITFGLDLPDIQRNVKGKDLMKRYSRQPRSFTVDVRGRLAPWLTWDWGIRENFPLTLEDRSVPTAEKLEFSYEQFSSYGRINVEATRRLNVLLYWGLEATDKEYRALDGSLVERHDTDRRVYQGRAEVRYRWYEYLVPYGGFRYFRYDNERDFLDRPTPSGRQLLREYLVYAGVEYYLTPYFLIRPELLAAHTDDVSRDAEPPFRTNTTHGFQGKFSLPVEIIFSRKAQVTALVSYDLDESRFGGGSMGLQMVF
jgi:hypothetical protein